MQFCKHLDVAQGWYNQKQHVVRQEERIHVGMNGDTCNYECCGGEDSHADKTRDGEIRRLSVVAVG